MRTDQNLNSIAALRAAQEAELRRRPLGLTAQEARTVATIQALTRGARSPSYQEIGAAAGIVKSRVSAIIAQLESKGWLARSPHRARSLRLLATLPAAELVEAIGVAAEHQAWCWTQGIGLFVMVEACGIPAPDTLTEAEAAGLLAEHWAGVKKMKEAGRG